MQTPVQIASRRFHLTPAWRERLERKIAKLAEFDRRIVACRVLIEAKPGHQRRGGDYALRVDVQVPRRLLVVDHEPAPSLAEAVEKAFDAMYGQLDALRRRHLHARRGPSGASAPERRGP